MIAFCISFFNRLLILAALHPLHVSVTEIVADPKEKQLEITTRVFADDLEQCLRKTFSKPDLDVIDQGKLVDELMKSYIENNLTIALDNKLQTLQYIGHELDGDAFVFYVEVTKVKVWRELKVGNSILMETFSDQSNLVNVKVDDEIQSLRLTKNSKSGVLSF